MPRAPRLFVEGGLYHVYNRVTRAERVFADDDEAARLVARLREATRRDGLVVLAWCVLPSHYHLVVRATKVPLWRTMASVQNGYTRSFNGRHRLVGPLWQGRYRAKVIQDPRYLAQVVLYVHLNPVAAGLAADPADYRWSGHREVRDRRRHGLVDPQELLLVFGERREAARRAYLAGMAAGIGEDWTAEAPGGLPSWQLGRPVEGEDKELETSSGQPFVDELGRSTGRERPPVDASALVGLVCERSGVSVEELGGRGKRRPVVRARELAATLGVERYALRVRDLAAAMGARYDTVSLWGRRGALRRCDDPEFRQELEELDAELAEVDTGAEVPAQGVPAGDPNAAKEEP